MALKKKNVFQGFLQDDYVPSETQQIVKYLTGKGNNLHEVESPDGKTFLVSMPKKFRQTVWLKRGDCLVIDPIIEGKKVLGEIFCVIPAKSVIELVNSDQWLPKTTTAVGSSGDGRKLEKSEILSFFSSNMKQIEVDLDKPTFPTSSEEEETEESEDEEEEESTQKNNNDEEDHQHQLLKNCTKVNSDERRCANNSSSDELCSAVEINGINSDEGYKSRVQFISSGVVTVTNVVNDITSLENILQSLDFDAEDATEEEAPSSTHSSCHKKANTIRIQVNYPQNNPDNDSSSPADNNFNNDYVHKSID